MTISEYMDEHGSDLYMDENGVYQEMPANDIECKYCGDECSYEVNETMLCDDCIYDWIENEMLEEDIERYGLEYIYANNLVFDFFVDYLHFNSSLNSVAQDNVSDEIVSYCRTKFMLDMKSVDNSDTMEHLKKYLFEDISHFKDYLCKERYIKEV